MEFTIRRATVADKEKVNQAHIRSIREVCSKDYKPEQIAAWSDVKYSDDIWEKTVHRDFSLVIERDNEIFGICHARYHGEGHGEIVGLYFVPEVIGKGFGKEMVNQSFEFLKNLGTTRVSVSGTLTAQKFYESVGFQVQETKKMNIRGVDIQCVCMEQIF